MAETTSTTGSIPLVAPSPTNFSSIPVLDYSLLSSPATRPTFIAQLQHALINVGFLYLSNHTVPASTIDTLISYIPRLFALPQEEKERVRMVHSPHFLGYSRFGAELTKGKVDQREQFDFGTPHETRWAEGTPEYWRVWGPAQVCADFFSPFLKPDSLNSACLQWPKESAIPGFHDAFELYQSQVADLARQFSSPLAEALGLAPDALDKFYDTKRNTQNRSKIIQYPVVTDPHADNQGVGPHYDSGFLTFVRLPFTSLSMKPRINKPISSSSKLPPTAVFKHKTSPANG